MHHQNFHHRMQLATPLLASMFGLLLPLPIFAQTFTRLTSTSNPIIADGGPIEYSGASWVDFDNDNDLDLFVNNDKLYRNDGNGVFTKITSGAIGNGSANRGWACAWADYNNDGYVDLAITHPANFVVGGATPNHLLRNDGPPNYTFTKITTGPIVTGLAAYTVGTWSDFDSDGDMDYFIGAGPADGTTSPDYLYRNFLKESGAANFERITSGVMATDQQDGQVWNWIDYDNDGDLDCYVANDNNQVDRYYRNNGNGSFTRVTNIAIASALTHRGATAGDYDNDGDLDLLAVGPTTALALYRNDTPGGNHWLALTCVGTTSNRAAIGAKVRVKATINGNAVWQLREISSQNTFNGHNSLRQHFGLGNATVIDSLKIEWPSGTIEVLKNVAANQFLTFTEGNNPTGVDDDVVVSPQDFSLEQNFPNPFNPTTNIKFALSIASRVTLAVYDVNGRIVAELLRAQQKNVGRHEVNFTAQNLASGIYFYTLEAVPITGRLPVFVNTKIMTYVK